MKVGRSARIVGQTKGTLVVGNIVSPCQQPSNSVKDSSYAPGSPISSCPYQQPTSPDNSNYQAPSSLNGNLNSPSISNSYVPPANPGINVDFSGPLANPSSPTSSDSYVKPAIPNSPV
uniref:Uncharacterized protein n=1 Tax=Romanomermis culicivorax TaxID=13658 RepID=A0A915K3W1_ROMCU